MKIRYFSLIFLFLSTSCFLNLPLFNGQGNISLPGLNMNLPGLNLGIPNSFDNINATITSSNGPTTVTEVS